jgi:hypothetical protein
MLLGAQIDSSCGWGQADAGVNVIVWMGSTALVGMGTIGIGTLGVRTLGVAVVVVGAGVGVGLGMVSW